MKVGTEVDETNKNLQHIEKTVAETVPKEYLKGYVTYAGLQQMESMDPLALTASHVGQVGVYLYARK